MALYLPIDEVTGSSINVDLAADFLELKAYFADDSTALTSELANAASLGAPEDHADLQEEMQEGEEEIVSCAVNRIETRQGALDSAYPFRLDSDGDLVRYELADESLGQAAYILSLVLSNLRAISPVLDNSGFHPDCGEVVKLRGYFQYLATAALAAEIQGVAWSFGFPRPDRSGFLNKLGKIWEILGDGRVEAQTGAPRKPKDDQIDVFAARRHRDGLPGFPLAVAQVATGRNPEEKSLKGHMDAFKSRWFRTPPVTNFMVYMIIPFARAEDQFFDDVRVMGNVLHRLRVARRVGEADRLVDDGVEIEGYDRLPEVARWVREYRSRERAEAA